MKTFTNLKWIAILCCICFSLHANSININLKLADEITVSPTENIGYVNIDLDIEATKDIVVHILDMYERPYLANFLEKEFETGKHSETLDLTPLPSGLYTIRVICEEMTVDQKLIIMSEM